MPLLSKECEVHSLMSDVNNLAKPLGRKVLCIDDDLDVLKFEKVILEGAGYEVLLASSGDEGVNLAKVRGVDLVLLDYEMPRMFGTDVAQRLRAIQPTLPIIMVSGGDLPEEAARIVDCFVPKTNKMATTLLREVKRLIHPGRICAFCSLPIQNEQVPSVLLEAGKEVHGECYFKMI